MHKTLAILATLVLSSLIALGQPSLSPKRIVYNGDTGVFFVRTQEVALLQANEYKSKYEEEWGLHQLTKKELSEETDRKIRWRKTAMWLGVGNLALGGTIFYLIKN